MNERYGRVAGRLNIKDCARLYGVWSMQVNEGYFPFNPQGSRKRQMYPSFGRGRPARSQSLVFKTSIKEVDPA
jgi:hypothetical protein